MRPAYPAIDRGYNGVMATINQSRSVRFYAIIFTVLLAAQGCSSIPRAQVPVALTEQALCDQQCPAKTAVVGSG